MPKQIKIVNVNDDSTYTDITDAVVENEKEENEPEETPQTEEVVEPEQPKPKARAKRVAKPKVIAETEVVEETPPEAVVPKPRAKRTAKVKILEQPTVIEPPIEKPKAVRKPRAKKGSSPHWTQNCCTWFPAPPHQDCCSGGSIPQPCCRSIRLILYKE